MTSFEEAFADSVTGPDERAAGVISGSDPYRELELYLEKVHDEIGEVFDKWSYLSEASKTSRKSSYRQENDGRTHCAIRPDRFLVNNHDTSFVKSCSLPSRRNSSRCESYLDAWSKSLLAEFGTVLQSGKSVDAIENAEDDYDEVAADSSDDDSMRMKYHISQRDDFEISSSSSPTVSPSTSEHSSSGSSGTRRTPPYLSRIGRGKQRSHVASVHNKCDPMLVNVKIYPTERLRVPETRKADYEFENSQRSYVPVKCYTGQNYSKSRLAVTDTGTQTSPAESRSSSFTWMSDCSEDDHSSTTSSTEDSRRLGDSSGDLTPVKDEPESGIGTASFPRHNKYNKSSSVQESDRKELWEKLRRRPKEKSGSTSWKSSASRLDVDRHKNCVPVESSSDPDLAVFRIPRPSRLPLASSSLSPESSRETLPSPSATSLTLGLEPCDLMVREFAGKSSSAPLLLKQPLYSSTQKVSQYSKFHSEKLLIEIEAAEACKWLRAAGFPQYAQMYEDKQFPIDLNSVQKDHQFLEPDALQSLFRRFQTLNKCANMKVELMPTKLNQDDESDSDTECALSEYWSFQRESRRWSRNRHASDVIPPTSAVEESCENVTVVMRNDNSTLPSFAVSQSEPEIPLSRFRRSGSERLRDGAKAFLRRVESLKSRRRKHKNRDGVVISEPQIVDIISMEARIKELNCVDVTPPESPVTLQSVNDSTNRYLPKPETDFSAFSDSEVTVRQTYLDCVNNCSKANALKMSDVSDLAGKRKQFTSRSDSQDSQAFCTAKATVQKKNEIVDSRVDVENDTPMRPKTTAISRWHSFQRHSVQPNSAHGQCINSLAVGQIVVLRKLAMLKLTAVMERHCLSHRTTGWNWELPKFIRKAKTPDFKDKSVFGLPLLANVQQTGYVLPPYIREALEWLRLNALDQVGIFRKPGVRSRINRLKFMANIKNAKISFDNQQPFDVADMVKQYFRELPDALLTNKLSDTFVSIFQYVPENLRKEALQCALILLPDEHRDALYILLAFLNLVAQHSYVNQMTASNLAMCLAPSLFHWTHSSAGHQIRRSSSVSPKRLQKSGTFPDVKELGQNKAAHECIHHLILNHQNLFMVSEDVMRQCHFSFMDESIPVSLDELGEELQQDWRGYLNMCRTALQKEIKDKNRGWITSTVWEDVEIAYKKVRDGHPLRLWRVYTEVEAPPKELLYRILRERHVWDPAFVQSKVVRRLDPDAELFQYVTSDVGPLPQKDFCVIRSWKTDLSKGGCMVVETSVEHPEAKTELNSVRGIVLASRYLIEPCGSGKSRILHLSRVDIKGKSSDWYNKCYGHICAQYLLRIRNSFQRMTEGPESKV